tara:strand:- start:419 stop:607 length:189 start_codon:yes stop_codon:yes gene_type:complete
LINPGKGEIEILATAIQLKLEIELFETIPVSISTFDPSSVVIERCILGRQDGMKHRLAAQVC